MSKQCKFAAILSALTLLALWTPVPAQTAEPGTGAAPLPPLESGWLAIHMEGTTTSTDSEQLRGGLYSALAMKGGSSDRHFSEMSFSLHDGRFEALIYCMPVSRPGRRSGNGGRGFAPAPLSPMTKELATAAQCAEFLKEQLTLAPDEAGWSADQRAARIALISNELLPISEAQYSLNRAVTKAGNNAETLIADRITAVRNEIQTVQFSLKAKSIRRTALEMALAQQQKHDADLGAQAEKQDALVVQLQQLIDLRKQQLEGLQRQYNAGLASPADLDAAKAAIAEAQVRLAERIGVLHAGGSKELDDRMTEELAMVSVDLTELEMRLKDLSSQMDLYLRAQDDPEAMKQLMHVDPDIAGFFPGSASTTRSAAGRGENGQSMASLETERFLLSVSDLSFTDASPVATAQ